MQAEDAHYDSITRKEKEESMPLGVITGASVQRGSPGLLDSINMIAACDDSTMMFMPWPHRGVGLPGSSNQTLHDVPQGGASHQQDQGVKLCILSPVDLVWGVRCQHCIAGAQLSVCQWEACGQQSLLTSTQTVEIVPTTMPKLCDRSTQSMQNGAAQHAEDVSAGAMHIDTLLNS